MNCILARRDSKSIKLNEFRYNLPQFNVFGFQEVILEIMPMKLTELYIQVGQANAHDYSVWWEPKLRIRNKDTGTWETLIDPETGTQKSIWIDKNSTGTYAQTFTSFNNNEYDAIGFNVFDAIRYTYSNTQCDPYVLVTGTVKDGNLNKEENLSG